MKQLSVYLFFSLLLIGKMGAQDVFILQGLVQDSITQEALVAVNIFDQESNSGTFSESDGRFKIKISKLPTTLVFSFIGYENYFLKLERKPDIEISILLKQSIFGLPGVEVIAEPKVEKLTKPIFTVKDFVIEEDKILVLKYGGIAVGNYLELRDLDGHILHSLSIAIKGIVENLHQSCLGNIHLVGTKEVVEVDVESEKISLISKYPRFQFERFLKPCVEASDDYVYYKREQLRGQKVRYDFISKENRIVKNSAVISDDENIVRMYSELGQYGLAESYYSAAVSHPNDPSITRPEVLDAWVGVFYKPIFSPLYNTGEDICLFNHTLGFLRFYTFDGIFKRQLPINYHMEDRWDKQILKDKKTEKFYTAYKDALGKKFYEINLQEGKVTPAFKMKCDFVEKMIIYDGYLYYQDSGILPGEVNRVLHRVKVN